MKLSSSKDSGSSGVAVVLGGDRVDDGAGEDLVVVVGFGVVIGILTGVVDVNCVSPVTKMGFLPSDAIVGAK